VVHLHSGPSVLCPDCLLPSPPCGATGTGLFRREPSNSTNGTFTHERNHLHGLLQCISHFWAPLLWSAVAKRSGDIAFDFTEALGTPEAAKIASHQSGVAPSLLPPQSISNRPWRRQVEEMKCS
jgi:hypothetical protein